MTKEQLQPFCSKDESRFVLCSPFSWGAWTYATDGRILVRVPRLADIGEVEKAPKIEGSAVWKQFPAQANWLPLPEIASKTSPCIACVGTGYVKLCKECDGEGTVVCEYEHEHECPTCAGDGFLDGAGTANCPKCHASGLIFEDKSLLIGCRKIAPRYYLQLKSLPSVLVASEFGDRLTALAFKFDGAEGLLMPMKYQPE